MRLCRNAVKMSKAGGSVFRERIRVSYERSQSQQDSTFLQYLPTPHIHSWRRRWPTPSTTRHHHRSCTYRKYSLVGVWVVCKNMLTEQHFMGRAPMVAMWADRFSRYCWRRFSRFLTCPLTLPPVSASHCLSSLLHAGSRCCLAAAVARERGWGTLELTRATLGCSDCNNLTVTEVGC